MYDSKGVTSGHAFLLFCMNKYFLILVLFFFLLHCRESTIYGGVDLDIKDTVTTTPVSEVALAFKGAEGFGRNATGGRGGKVLMVTNLNDSGPGSLRWACDQSGARYILFNVSGYIVLKSRLVIQQGDVTIAGQTAPGDGICIKDFGVIISADNVIIRFMRFRLGDDAQQEADALEARFHKNIIIDHCSMSWSTDETASFYANENTSLQWCIISESLKNSVHAKGAHGYGGIWGGKNASFHHNLLAHHDSRNPRLGEEAGKAFALTDLVDLRNNVIYNWGSNSCYGGESMNANIVNCYYKPGPATSKKERIIAIDKNLTEGTEVYNRWGSFFIDGNYMEGSAKTTEDNWSYGVINQLHAKYGMLSKDEWSKIKRSTPFDIGNNIFTHSAIEAYDRVVAVAGASFSRDSADLRIISDVIHRTYSSPGSNGSLNGIIDAPSDAGGYPALKQTDPAADQSKDGIPDAWQKLKGLDPTKPEANGHQLSTGYENLEVYLDDLVQEILLKQK